MSTIFNKPQVVVPGTSNGLVSLNGVPGNTTGNAIASGYVGEQQAVSNWSAQSSLTTNTSVNVTSLSLTAGVWAIYGAATILSTTGNLLEFAQLSISTTTATSNYLATAQISANSSAALSDVGLVVNQYLVLSSTKPVYLVAFGLTTSGTWGVYPGGNNGGNGQFYAVRIA